MGDATMAELHARSADRTFEASPIEAELRNTARTNAAANKTVARRAARRARVEYVVAALLAVISVVWLADNVVGYFTSNRIEAQAPTSQIDCWTRGAETTVWRAAAPVGKWQPLRCGDNAFAIAVPGPMSAGVIAVGLLAGFVMWRVARKRWRANWY